MHLEPSERQVSIKVATRTAASTYPPSFAVMRVSSVCQSSSDCLIPPFQTCTGVSLLNPNDQTQTIGKDPHSSTQTSPKLTTIWTPPISHPPSDVRESTTTHQILASSAPHLGGRVLVSTTSSVDLTACQDLKTRMEMVRASSKSLSSRLSKILKGEWSISISTTGSCCLFRIWSG